MRNAVLITALVAAGHCVAAEPYPVRPVQVIVPYGTGGATDIAARIMAQQLGEQTGKPFLVENRPGASGTVGAAYVAKSAANGYVLGVADPSWTTVPGMYKSLSYDLLRDFTPIVQLVRVPNAMVVRAPGHATLKDFIASARQNPGKFNFASSGPGGINHLAPELFNKAAGVRIVHVAYKSGGETLTALLGDQVQMVIAPVLSVLPLVQSGKLRALAVTTDGKRVPVLPDVPSMAEVGVTDMDVYYWNGLVGPAAMPGEVVRLLNAESVKALRTPSVAEKFITQSAEIMGTSPESFSNHLRSELRRWTEVIKSAGITAE